MLGQELQATQAVREHQGRLQLAPPDEQEHLELRGLLARLVPQALLEPEGALLVREGHWDRLAQAQARAWALKDLALEPPTLAPTKHQAPRGQQTPRVRQGRVEHCCRGLQGRLEMVGEKGPENARVNCWQHQVQGACQEQASHQRAPGQQWSVGGQMDLQA